MEITIGKTRLEIFKGDITKENVDAIVNAANSSLMGGGGVDGAIHAAGGFEILNECTKIVQKYGRLPTGQAVITTAGNLEAKFVIHTVGPVWYGGENDEQMLLTNAYYNSLKLGVENKVSSIAFPSISTGVYGYPIEKACPVALNTTVTFLKNEKHSYSRVRFILFSVNDYAVYETNLKIFKVG
jgi:O-acetyl-ADP-ribose deacetylase (regulator of RNase III)